MLRDGSHPNRLWHEVVALAVVLVLLLGGDAESQPVARCIGSPDERTCERAQDCVVDGCFRDGMRIGDCTESGECQSLCSGGPCGGLSCNSMVPGCCPPEPPCPNQSSCACQISGVAPEICRGRCSISNQLCFQTTGCLGSCIGGECTNFDDKSCDDEDDCFGGECQTGTCIEAEDLACVRDTFECGPLADLVMTQSCELLGFFPREWVCEVELRNLGPDPSADVLAGGRLLVSKEVILAEGSCSALTAGPGEAFTPEWRLSLGELQGGEARNCRFVLRPVSGLHVVAGAVSSFSVLDPSLGNNGDSEEYPIFDIFSGGLRLSYLVSANQNGRNGRGHGLALEGDLAAQLSPRYTLQLLFSRWELSAEPGEREDRLDMLSLNARHHLGRSGVRRAAIDLGAGIYDTTNDSWAGGIHVGTTVTLVPSGRTPVEASFRIHRVALESGDLTLASVALGLRFGQRSGD